VLGGAAMQIEVAGGRRLRGLTLVELLLALVAIMIMATLGWKAATTAIKYSNNARTTAEIGAMSKGLEDFAIQFGDYPPDFHDSAAVWKFLKTRFPECPHYKYPINLCDYGPESALYFWLAGPNGQGFSANPANPFAKGGDRIGPFFKFIPDQLKMVDGCMQYFPPRGIDGSPYVYFRGGPKGYDGHPGWPPVHPYRDSKRGGWIYGDKFQILSPGSDGKYGAGNHFPDGPDYDEANLDDIANFSQGDTLGDARPKTVVDKK
jgi:Tfp pilus assembly protein PilE